jgi:hypothetical protein
MIRTALRERVARALARIYQAIDNQALQDIERERQRQALASTARFVDEHLSHLQPERGPDALFAKLSLLHRGLDMAPKDGLVLEFGVGTGFTMREIARRRLPAHGFDSFQGLPEHWRSGFTKGTFAQGLPNVDGANLHVGWFSETLPAFLAEHGDTFAFVHMDADLYSSTKTVFDLAQDRFIRGTVVLFDEYFNYPGWQHHEHQAFTEFVTESGRQCEYLGYNPLHEQVLVRIIA